MSEAVGRSITDLESRISKFGKANKSDEEVTEFKKWLKKELEENIRPNLIGLLKELQEKLPSELTMAQRNLFLFSGYGYKCILTKYGVEKIKHPYDLERVEYLVDVFMRPDKKKYPNEHNLSLGGAKFLWEQINEKTHDRYELKGKYLVNKPK